MIWNEILNKLRKHKRPFTPLDAALSLHLNQIDVRITDVRLKRKAYVCDQGEVQYQHDEGFTTITDAFIQRPANCKYCVFESNDKALLVNMYELRQDPSTNTLSMNQYTKTFDSVDAAIMYVLMTE